MRRDRQPARDPRRHLRARRPTFESVEQFVRFVHLVGDRWQRPAPPSSFERHAEILRLGTHVDTSPPPVHHHEPTEVYHLAWVGPVVRAIRDTVIAESDAGRRRWRCWRAVHFGDATQSGLSDTYDVDQSTISRDLHRARSVVRRELVRRGLIRE